MNVIRAGELVYSRDEWDEAGAAEAKVVEEVFARFAGVLHLHLPNGAVIRTTHEHPFFVSGQGWTPANQLQPGDRLMCADRTTVAVEEVFDTGEWEAVYNLRVADHHTYFVGEQGWGWEVWAHNLCMQGVEKQSKFVIQSGQGNHYISQAGDTFVRNAQLARSFNTLAAAQREAKRINDSAAALYDALHTVDSDFTTGMADGLFIDYGGPIGAFENYKSQERGDEERTVGTDGLFFALISAHTQGNAARRPKLDWSQAEQVFRSLVRGWKTPTKPAFAELNQWVPGLVDGYALPSPKVPDPRYALNRMDHFNGAVYEQLLAYQIHGGTLGTQENLQPAEIVISWRDRIGTNGADVISVNPVTGVVTLWDSKFRTATGAAFPSPTFNEVHGPTTRDAAINVVSHNTTLSTSLKQLALDSLNLRNGLKYRQKTVRYSPGYTYQGLRETIVLE